MYFDLFVTTLLVAYFAGIYFFYLDIIRITALKKKYLHKSLFHLIVIEIIFQLPILLFVILSTPLLYMNVNFIYGHYTSVHKGVDLNEWGEYVYLLFFFSITAGISIVLIYLRYIFIWREDDSGKRQGLEESPEEICEPFFSMYKAKKMYFLLGFLLVIYFILSIVQYNRYLDHMEAYFPEGHSLSYTSESSERKLEEFIDEKHQGQLFDAIYTKLLNEGLIATIYRESDVPQDGFIYRIKLRFVRKLYFNIWGGNESCEVYLKFSRNEIFSYSMADCRRWEGWSLYF